MCNVNTLSYTVTCLVTLTAWAQILGFATYKLCDLGKVLNISTVAQKGM